MELKKKLEEKLTVIGDWLDVRQQDGYDKDDTSFPVWDILDRNKKKSIEEWEIKMKSYRKTLGAFINN